MKYIKKYKEGWKNQSKKVINRIGDIGDSVSSFISGEPSKKELLNKKLLKEIVKRCEVKGYDLVDESGILSEEDCFLFYLKGEPIIIIPNYKSGQLSTSFYHTRNENIKYSQISEDIEKSSVNLIKNIDFFKSKIETKKLKRKYTKN